MKKLFYKLFSKAERALMMKDLSALCRRRLILTLLIALPLVFAVAFPLLFLFVSAMVSPESSGVEQFKNLLDNIPQGTDERAQMFYIFTAFISPMLFMLIPLLSAIITASYTFAGERAHGTMETLLFAPFSVRRFLQVKAASSVLASGLVTAVSFILFFVVTTIGDMVLKAPFFFDLSWFVLVFLLSPAITVLGVTFAAMLTVKARSTAESIQISGYIVLPLIFIGQIMCLYRLNSIALLILTAIIVVIDLCLFNFGFRRFTAEKLLTRPPEKPRKEKTNVY